MKSRDYRWLVVLLANLLLIWLSGLANHHLSQFPFLWLDQVSLYLYVPGLFVVYPALRLDYRHGFTATLLTGLAFDAISPAPFGTHLVLLGLVHATLLYGRGRFPRDEPIFATVVALFCNLFLFLVLSFFLIGAGPRPAHAWLRLFVDLIASQIVIGLITPWFLALQREAMALARLHPETGKRTDL
jgi:rod shape-determining protein MreD